MSSSKRRKFDTSQGLLPGYFVGMQDAVCKERYRTKLEYLGGMDPYELPRNDWEAAERNVTHFPLHLGCYTHKQSKTAPFLLRGGSPM